MSEPRRVGLGYFLSLLVVGVALGYFVPGWFGPSRGDIRAAAREFVPDGAEITHEGENTGSSLVSGTYFAVIDFDGGAPDREGLVNAAEALAQEHGWTFLDAQEFEGATELNFGRDGILADVSIPTMAALTQGLDTILGGHIVTERDPAWLTRWRLAGGGAGVVLAVWLTRLRNQRAIARSVKS